MIYIINGSRGKVLVASISNGNTNYVVVVVVKAGVIYLGICRNDRTKRFGSKLALKEGGEDDQ